jgi:dihydroorotate dehydrogenase
MIYDKSQSFEYNVKNGLYFDRDLVLSTILDKTRWSFVFGYPLALPLGIPACSIMTGKGIAAMSKLGFSIFTYKTVRSCPSDAHPLPNICYVDGSREITRETINSVVVEQEHFQENKAAFANSFGNNCYDWQWLQEDIAYARSCLKEGQLLFVSVYGTEQTDCDEAQDFARTALLAQEAGAHVIEINLSCPNVKGVLAYKESEIVYKISKEVTGIVSIPVIIKVGVFDSTAQMEATLSAATYAGIHGICGINTVPMQVITNNGEPVFGEQRIVAGVSGNPIRKLGQEFIKDARNIIDLKKLNLTLLAAGGVLTPTHIDEYRTLGADVVMSATGAMCNPLLASEWINTII